MSVKLLKECSEDNPDIELIKVYLNQEDCDVNVTENDEVYINLYVHSSG